MELKQETIRDVNVISIKGRLDVTTTPNLEQTFAKVFEQEKVKVLVDCTELEYISSAGLRALLTAAKTAKKTDGKIVLSCLNANVQQIFEISGFTSIFDIYETCDTAIDSLQ